MKDRAGTTFAIFISISLNIFHVDGGCYFPVEVQGEYVTQSMIDSEIAYTSVTIAYNSIPGWGHCYSRLGGERQHHILQDVTVNGDSCFKCVQLRVRSPNILQVHALDSVYQCHKTPEEAEAVCPSRESIVRREAREVMLYKTRGYYGARDSFEEVLCPLYGQWRFSYTDSGDSTQSCSSSSNLASTCQAGYKLDLQFRGCSYPSQGLEWKCLGGWVGEDGQQYISLLDTKLVQMDEAPRPRYRCGVYSQEGSVTWLSLSNDSSCSHGLESPRQGYQTLELHSLHPVVETCQGFSLPAWVQGDWGDLRVWRGRAVLRDEVRLTEYQLEAVSSPAPGRYHVRVEGGGCGVRPGWACLSLEQRNQNVVEVRLGRLERRQHSQLCSDTAFTSSWVTLTRSQPHQEESDACPLVGQYSGTVPDGEGLCARSTTLCSATNLMTYQVYNCVNTSEIYEDRLYRCYGVFQENGLVYTPVRRLDLPNKECFAGITITEGDNKLHKIIEAGTDCGRNKNPETAGMVLKYESQYCDSLETDANQERHQTTVKVATLNCVNNVINNELNEHQNSNANHTVGGSHSRETIETVIDKEVVEDGVTLLSHSVKNSQQSLLLSFLFAIFILQL